LEQQHFGKYEQFIVLIAFLRPWIMTLAVATFYSWFTPQAGQSPKNRINISLPKLYSRNVQDCRMHGNQANNLSIDDRKLFLGHLAMLRKMRCLPYLFRLFLKQKFFGVIR
jgi:hypothetical protein